MCQYAKGVVTTYQPISFSVTSLHPYQAMVTYQDMKAASDWFGFAKMQIALANSFYHGSIHHQRAMEIMTNSSFQKPIIYIHQKVSAKSRGNGKGAGAGCDHIHIREINFRDKRARHDLSFSQQAQGNNR